MATPQIEKKGEYRESQLTTSWDREAEGQS